MQSASEDSLPLRAESPHGRLCRQYVVIKYCTSQLPAGKNTMKSRPLLVKITLGRLVCDVET